MTTQAGNNPLTTGTPTATSPLTPDPLVGKQTGREESLANWAGPYVTQMLGKAQALSESPYQVYQGPFTAGAAPLQMQAFQGIGGLGPAPGLGTAQQTAETVGTKALGATYQPVGQSFTTPGIAGQYMNPYLQQALQPQLDELRRQADIQRTQNAARMTKAGAFGGGRQAIMESELGRNLLQQIGKTTGEAYSTAYDKAAAQFNAEQQRRAQEAQFGATYGLDALSRALSAAQAGAQIGQTQSAEERANLAQQLGAGAQQRAIEQEGITADLNEFLQQRDYPMKQVQFLQSMLQGLPISAVSQQYQQPSGLSQFYGQASDVLALLKQLGIGGQ